ncbi:MAG: hypothetical protein IPJ19_07565 [Planctomycetes bacterium]|nr:hypothetical protein [Planctomycetota bacterium]
MPLNAPLLLALTLLGSDTKRIDLRVQEPTGYPGNPSTLATPLRQDIDRVELERNADGTYRMALHAEKGAPAIDSIELRSFVPRIPALARGNATLERLALMQREFNRNETRCELADGVALKVANNCLRGGLWEVMTERKLSDGKTALDFHAWLPFPEDLYGELFREVNGRDLAPVRADLMKYPDFAGFAVPLEALRTVERVEPLSDLRLHAAEKPIAFGEQQRKHKLLLTPGIETYADFYAGAKQPIATAKFNEPGFYDSADPMRFDLTWLAHPVSAVLRHVKGVADPIQMQEVEIVYENGRRLILGDSTLATLPARSELPTKDAETLRATFGICTPEIYASAAERAAEYAAPRAGYLLLLDKDGKNLDNHMIGIDRAFVFREKGAKDRLNLLLVGYERITTVSRVSVELP